MSKYDQISNAIRLEDILVENEEILWSGTPKKSAFIINKVLTMLPIAMIWLLFDGTFIITLFHTKINSGGWMLIIFFALHLMPVWIWLSNVFTANRKWKNTKYVITDHRIIITTGFIGMDYQTLYYKDIKEVQLKIGTIDKLLKVGDIYLNSMNNYHSMILDVENPYEVYSRLQKIVLDIQTDIEYPNKLRPDENPGYQTKYRP